MRAVYSTSSLIYAVFLCSEEGDPQNPAAKHAPAINMSQNEKISLQKDTTFFYLPLVRRFTPNLIRLTSLTGGAIRQYRDLFLAQYVQGWTRG